MADILNIISESQKKSKKQDIGTFVDILKEDSFQSVLTGLQVRFDANNRLIGKGEIMIGRKKEPFMTPIQIEEDLKQKALKNKLKKTEKRIEN